MKPSILLGVVTLATVFITGILTQRAAIACHWYAATDFVAVGNNVYVDSTMPFQQVYRIKDLLHGGKSRVERTYGIMISKPTIVVTLASEFAGRFVDGDVSTMISSPLGQCIVVAPRGLNADVFAHELVHAEVADRVGYLSYKTDLPAWFEEGIALSVDNREPYRRFNINVSDQQVDNVTTLFYRSQLNNSSDLLANAQAAKLAVAKILQKIHPKGLYQHLERVREGSDFEEIFALQ